MNPYNNPNNDLNNSQYPKTTQDYQRTFPALFQPQQNENQRQHQMNQLNQMNTIKQIKENSEMRCQQRDNRENKEREQMMPFPQQTNSIGINTNRSKSHDNEMKPKKSKEVDMIGQRLKRTQVERKELVKAIHHAYQIMDKFEHDPDENDKILFAYEIMEQACSKLKRGVTEYLKDYVMMRNIVMSNIEGDEEDERIIKKLSEWTCSENTRLTKCFDTYKTVFDENNFFEAIKNKVNVNVVIKDCMGNIFGCHVACAPTQKNLAVIDKTHFIFSLKNVNTPGSAEKQYFPRKPVESFVVFYKSHYVFCVPYAFAIGPYGKSSISPRLERVYVSKDSNFKCSFEEINSTAMPDTFPIEWVKVFVQ